MEDNVNLLKGQVEVEISSVSNLVRDDTLKLTCEAFSLASVMDGTDEEHLVIAHLTIDGLFSVGSSPSSPTYYIPCAAPHQLMKIHPMLLSEASTLQSQKERLYFTYVPILTGGGH